MIEELLVEDGNKVVAGQELFKIRLTDGGAVWHILLHSAVIITLLLISVSSKYSCFIFQINVLLA